MDTIVCMDGTEVIGAFLAEEFEKEDMASTNRHETIYVVLRESGTMAAGSRQWHLCSARYLRWMDLRYTRCSMQRIFRDMRLIPQMTVHSVKKESSWMPWSMDSVILSYDQK